jgi:predicted RNA binding protein YcfA (HicA-like mRNA interferase family)
MPSKYPVLKPKEIICALQKIGFEFKTQKGSHAKYVCNGRAVIIPMHEEVRKGTLKSILAQAGLSLEEFEELL